MATRDLVPDKVSQLFTSKTPLRLHLHEHVGVVTLDEVHNCSNLVLLFGNLLGVRRAGWAGVSSKQNPKPVQKMLIRRHLESSLSSFTTRAAMKVNRRSTCTGAQLRNGTNDGLPTPNLLRRADGQLRLGDAVHDADCNLFPVRQRQKRQQTAGIISFCFFLKRDKPFNSNAS
jgi:hypothetical protein